MADWMLDPPEDDEPDYDDFDGSPYDEDWGDSWEDDEAAANASSDWENERDRY